MCLWLMVYALVSGLLGFASALPLEVKVLIFIALCQEAMKQFQSIRTHKGMFYLDKDKNSHMITKTNLPRLYHFKRVIWQTPWFILLELTEALDDSINVTPRKSSRFIFMSDTMTSSEFRQLNRFLTQMN